jgi:osmotically-inducible protein OsmY
MLSDIEVAQSVTWQLEWDPGCKQAHITATVDDGIVTLYGYVSTTAEHEAARRAALRAVGVIDLADNIGFRTPGGAATTSRLPRPRTATS